MEKLFLQMVGALMPGTPKLTQIPQCESCDAHDMTLQIERGRFENSGWPRGPRPLCRHRPHSPYNATDARYANFPWQPIADWNSIFWLPTIPHLWEVCP